MRTEGDYQADGYALIRNCVSREVAQALLHRIQSDTKARFLPLESDSPGKILKRGTFEIYGNAYPPLQCFLWGLTGTMEAVTGRALLPTYDFFRLYAAGDICRVHRDRPACEHSLSLTLAYSDGRPWPLELGRAGQHGPPEGVSDSFGEEAFTTLAMEAGDAVAYRGTEHRHGRTVPNPNRWSAHLFLHWVDRDGPNAAEAFDGTAERAPVEFTFFDRPGAA